MVKGPLVSVLIVNWNGEEIIPDCLNSLFKQDYKNIEVIVVDNNSSDNSRKIIRKFEKVMLVESKKNLGFAGGNNLGYKSVNGEYVLLLNTDTIVTKDFLTKLIDHMESDSSVGIIQPKVLYTGDRPAKVKKINSVGSYLTNTGFLYYPGYGKPDAGAKYNTIENIFSAYGACMLIQKNILEKVGFFDPDYFMYFEETDFCMRVGIAGWKVVYAPDAVIYHKGAVSSKKFGMGRIYFHSFKNRMCTYLKNLELGSLIMIMPLHLLICEATSLMYLLTGRAEFFIAIQKAFLWNITNLPKTLAKRRIIQKKIRKITDKEYFSFVYKKPRISYYLYLFKGLQYYKD